MKYACIDANRMLFPVIMMCRVLGVSRAGFYAAQGRAINEPASFLVTSAILAPAASCAAASRSFRMTSSGVFRFRFT